MGHRAFETSNAQGETYPQLEKEPPPLQFVYGAVGRRPLRFFAQFIQRAPQVAACGAFLKRKKTRSFLRVLLLVTPP